MTIHEWREAPAPRRKPDLSGRCGYPNGRRPDGLCGRVPVAGYVNRRGPGIAWRCTAHDKGVVVEAAERMGFVRQAVEG